MNLSKRFISAVATTVLLIAVASPARGVTYSASAIPFTFTDVSLTGTPMLGSTDDSFRQVALPFTFDFYGTEYNDIFIGSNGDSNRS
jgi:hypothetical protein